MKFAPEYVAFVLNENFEDAKALLLSPLMAIHHAHLVMLAERGLVGPADAHRLREALDSVAESDVRTSPYDASCEDLFFYVDKLLVERCGTDVAGRLHIARSRNDIDMTMYRMWQRRFLLDVRQDALALRETLLGLATRFRDAIFPAHTHTQPAQPTTVGHYLMGMIAQLERDGVRLAAAFATTNRCPLGACAITGTGFPIDRDLTSALLGFDGPTGNTYDSIATVDYLLESASATSVLAVGVGRFVQDLLLWCTAEVDALRLGEGFVQSSSIMPQKRNPVALEHARAIASKAVGQASAIVQCVHNTPYGDIVDTEDDLQPLVFAMFRDASRAVRLVSAALAGAEFNVPVMAARAREGWITVTELADTLVRRHGLAFTTSHAVAARLVARRKERPEESLSETLAKVSREVLGEALRYREEELDLLLSPEHFVAVRQTPGGPSAERVAEAIAASRAGLEADREQVSGDRARLDAAETALRERARAL